ncbi:heavy metal sensor histidine kinase [Herminiimonas contaminans]|uniref:Sensor protein n=1 Tax=Herminiimonas contaminans TaxID=1111140 RepID=A0ABS0EY45_9BURK|nr:heavy metal sensor histidine kinase [Herminiimonas contaminans]
MGKISVMRHLAAEKDSIADIQRDPHSFRDAAASHDNLILLLKNQTGTVVLHMNEEQGGVPTIPLIPLNSEVNENSIKMIDTTAGLTARAIGAQGRTRNGDIVELIVARTTSDRMRLLKSYYIEVWLASICGTLIAALSGFILARRSLLPIRSMANKAKSITAHRLDTHLDTSSVPQELSELVLAFNEMMDRLNGSFQRLNQFSADLAHDFRTPLNNLMLQTQVALSKARSVEDYQALLDSNIEEYERLSHMVDNMLFLARAENTHIVLKKKSLSCDEELSKIAEYFEGIADEAGLSIEIHATGNIYADPILLRRAMHNLVANAIKHASANSVIQIMTITENNQTILKVKNQGNPIAADHIEHLFDRFYRVDSARSNAATSTGLGLAIVRSIMNLHNGSVKVSCSHDGITSFDLCFPKEGD